MQIKGIVRLDKRTKSLAKRIKKNEIALIDHADIDSTAANMLVDAKVQAVINTAKSCSGRYPNLGPRMLINAGIPVLDRVEPNLFETIKEGDSIEIVEDSIFRNGEKIAQGVILTSKLVEKQFTDSRENLSNELEKFAENTLSYVTKEKSLLLDPTNLPEVKTAINNKHALVVVRGESYKEDLAMIRSYIRDVKPVLIGVDGGADALVEMGLKPDIIVGDMDSVGDSTLRKGTDIIVHAYTNGKAPGLPRVQKLGIDPIVCAVPGTSEDLALLLAYEKGAEMIVAVGTHSHLVDFLDKGRSGMSSTFLVRLKVDNRLVDAKGVSKLYHAQPSVRYVGLVAIAAFIAILVIIALSPAIQDRMYSVVENFRLQSWEVYTKFKLWKWSK